MENLMDPDFIRNILRQNIYDEEDTFYPGTSECNTLKLDPDSLTSTCKWYKLQELFLQEKEGGKKENLSGKMLRFISSCFAQLY